MKSSRAIDFELSNHVEQQAQSALGSSSVYDLRKLRVESSGDSLLIRGAVSSFYHKQLAQELVRRVVREMLVVNTVDVR